MVGSKNAPHFIIPLFGWIVKGFGNKKASREKRKSSAKVFRQSLYGAVLTGGCLYFPFSDGMSVASSLKMTGRKPSLQLLMAKPGSRLQSL